jgi:hypothetical protein
MIRPVSSVVLSVFLVAAAPALASDVSRLEWRVQALESAMLEFKTQRPFERRGPDPLIERRLTNLENEIARLVETLHRIEQRLLHPPEKKD